MKKKSTLQSKPSTVQNSSGFTLIELLVVVAIIGILATVVLSSLGKARTRAKTTKAISELRSIAQSVEIYHIDNNDYPSDVSPNVLPIGMSTFLPGGWPEAPYANSEYDWEYWGSGTVNEAVQVSIRFCNGGTCNFPDEPWASSFTSNQNAAYYCISGECRPWETDIVGAVAGHCFNC